MEDGGFLDDSLLGDGLCHVFNRQVGGDQCHAQVLVHEYHKRLFAFAYAGLNVLGVSRELKSRTLYSSLVDRCSHQYVIKSAAEVGHSSVECHEGCLSSLLRGLSEFYLHLVVETCQQVQSSVACLLGRVDDAEVGLQFQRLAMVCSNLG